MDRRAAPENFLLDEILVMNTPATDQPSDPEQGASRGLVNAAADVSVPTAAALHDTLLGSSLARVSHAANAPADIHQANRVFQENSASPLLRISGALTP